MANGPFGLRANQSFGPIMNAIDLIVNENLRQRQRKEQQESQAQRGRIGLFSQLLGDQTLTPETRDRVFESTLQQISDPTFQPSLEELDVQRKPTGLALPPAIAQRLGITDERRVTPGEFTRLTSPGLLGALETEQRFPLSKAAQAQFPNLAGQTFTAGELAEFERAATARAGKTQKKLSVGFTLSDGRKAGPNQANEVLDNVDEIIAINKALIDKGGLAEELELKPDGTFKQTKKRVGANTREIAKQFNKLVAIRGKIIQGGKLTPEEETILFGGQGVFRAQSQEFKDVETGISEALKQFQEKLQEF